MKTDQEMQELERSFAYSGASDVIQIMAFGEVDEAVSTDPQWYDTLNCESEDALAMVADAVEFLEWRGLIEHHPDHPHWVQILDESEPLPGKAAA